MKITIIFIDGLTEEVKGHLVEVDGIYGEVTIRDNERNITNAFDTCDIKEIKVEVS